MRLPLNPFWVIVAIAFVALFLIVLISQRRIESQALPRKNEPQVTTNPGAPATLVVVLALAVLLVPVGFVAAVLWGPEIGFIAVFHTVGRGVDCRGRVEANARLVGNPTVSA